MPSWAGVKQAEPKVEQGMPGVKQVEPMTEQDDDTTIWTITGGQTEGYYIHLNLDKQPIRMELDIPLAVSVMSEKQWEEMFGNKNVQPQFEDYAHVCRELHMCACVTAIRLWS